MALYLALTSRYIVTICYFSDKFLIIGTLLLLLSHYSDLSQIPCIRNDIYRADSHYVKRSYFPVQPRLDHMILYAKKEINLKIK